MTMKEERMKNLVYEISSIIEEQFDTVILRKMFVNENHPFFWLFSKGEEGVEYSENKFGIKLISNPEKEFLFFVFVPTDYDGNIMNKDLKLVGKNFQDVIEYFIEKYKAKLYDGGQIRMSYAITECNKEENVFLTTDTLLVPNLHDKIESMAYRRFVFYV